MTSFAANFFSKVAEAKEVIFLALLIPRQKIPSQYLSDQRIPNLLFLQPLLSRSRKTKVDGSRSQLLIFLTLDLHQPTQVKITSQLFSPHKQQSSTNEQPNTKQTKTLYYKYTTNVFFPKF